MDVQSEPATPAAGQIVFWFDTGSQRIASKNSAGAVTFYQPALSAPPGPPYFDDAAQVIDDLPWSPGQRLSRQNLDADAKGWAIRVGNAAERQWADTGKKSNCY